MWVSEFQMFLSVVCMRTIKEPGLRARLLLVCVEKCYPPKLSYIIDSGSTPRLSSIDTTDFDIGPGPHI